MATSISKIAANLAANNTATQLLTGKSQSLNMAGQAITGITSLGENFSSIFNGIQQVNNKLTQLPPSSIDNESDSISIMQQNIFSSLGLGGLSNGTGTSVLELLSSQSSIEFMQASLLSALQTSIFSPQPEINTTTSNEITASNKIETTNDTNTVIIEGSTLNSLAQLSFGEDGLDYNDAFDIVNILQHIPVVSAFYQDVTEQEDISMISKLAGGYLYGGPSGLAYSALNLAIESYSGTSISEAVLNFNYDSLFSSEDAPKEQQITSQTPVKQFNFLNR